MERSFLLSSSGATEPSRPAGFKVGGHTHEMSDGVGLSTSMSGADDDDQPRTL
jgi:hypothetical protein